ncbi:MAG: MotA/TolQ/ExbB proton channel family protein [Verrucomicrobiae bacterium]|nr:MotA/TolQ/ExbB proton channel family protein [Verrucomicrobiae bacterium]
MTIHSLDPLLASGALQFAFERATLEGKITIGTLVVVSLFSWTVILSKVRQLWVARREARKFFNAYRAARDPLELSRTEVSFDGAPAYHLYLAGSEELAYHLEHHAVTLDGRRRVSGASFDSVKVALERTASAEALALEKGMVVLSTAVAGGPFIGLLGTVWGVMETFSGVARANSASLTAMAPGVAGALIATVVGLMVAIPAMFAYNFMVTSIRAITQELDNFASEYATALEHAYVDNRPLAEELAASNRILAEQLERSNESLGRRIESALREGVSSNLG